MGGFSLCLSLGSQHPVRLDIGVLLVFLVLVAVLVVPCGLVVVVFAALRQSCGEISVHTGTGEARKEPGGQVWSFRCGLRFLARAV